MRAEALDDYVFDRIRTALLRPDTLLAGEQAVAARTPNPDDEILSAELTRLDRKSPRSTTNAASPTSTGPAGSPSLRCNAAAAMSNTAAQSSPPAATTSQSNAENSAATTRSIRSCVQGFASRVTTVIDHIGSEEVQKLFRVLVEEVPVTGWERADPIPHPAGR